MIFFYINHFSLIIFYHSVGWALNYLSREPRCIVNCCSLRSRAKDMTITIVTINPQTGNGAGVRMTSCPEEMVLRIWGFWKKESVESWTIKARVACSAMGSWIWTVERCSWDFRISIDRDLKHHKMRHAWGWSQIVWLA